MVNLGFMHCDETGTRIDGKTWWGHNASDMDFTFLSVDRKRGRIGMDAVCCAHLLRELNGVEENYPEQKWATQFKELLTAMKKAKDKALAAGKDEVSYYHLHKFDKQYDEILKTAYEENPLPEPTAKKRGRQKRSKVLNLICRLENYKASVCLFIRNLHVPFDNNLPSGI